MRKRGFTLAEVLITLGIIGIVASMTIPTLLSNIRSHEYRTRLKKAFSTLSQAAKMSQAQYGFDYAGITEKCGTNAETEHPEKKQTICAILNGTLTGATYYDKASDIKMIKDGKEVNYEFNLTMFGEKAKDCNAYVLSDGTIIAIKRNLGSNGLGCSRATGTNIGDIGDATTGTAWCFGFIDVNGTKLPNKEITCSKGSNSINSNTCIVKNDAKHLTDIYPIRFHDGTVEPATASVRYVLNTTK